MLFNFPTQTATLFLDHVPLASVSFQNNQGTYLGAAPMIGFQRGNDAQFIDNFKCRSLLPFHAIWVHRIQQIHWHAFNNFIEDAHAQIASQVAAQ